jgi:hypothetical protein
MIQRVSIDIQGSISPKGNIGKTFCMKDVYHLVSMNFVTSSSFVLQSLFHVLK